MEERDSLVHRWVPVAGIFPEDFMSGDRTLAALTIYLVLGQDRSKDSHMAQWLANAQIWSASSIHQRSIACSPVNGVCEIVCFERTRGNNNNACSLVCIFHF